MSELHVGMRNGMNANTLYFYDGETLHDDTAVATVFGVPLHKSVTQLEGDPRLDLPRQLCAAWNAKAAHVADLEACITDFVKYEDDRDDQISPTLPYGWAVDRARARLAKAKGGTDVATT